MNLAQVGEFSFVLAVAGLTAGVISNDVYQAFLSASVLTMLLTPFMMQASPFISERLSSQKLLRRLESIKELSGPEDLPTKRRDHVIIIGFGLNGKNLARVLRGARIPYVVLEFNTSTVTDMKKQGEPIYYGDGTKSETLNWIGIKTAKALVIVISDPASTRNIVKTARRQHTNLFIIARTRYTSEVDDLLRLGADEVIPEEFETSVEIFSRLLTQYQTPKNEIFNFVDMIREDGYKTLRQTRTAKQKPFFDKYTLLSSLTIELFTINEPSPVLGKSIEDLKFRTKTGTSIIAIERGKMMHTSPDPNFSFEAGDIVFITGRREDINKALVYLTEGKIDGL
jgi:CPA2 family monovalent cation:H+ antiporter-2